MWNDTCLESTVGEIKPEICNEYEMDESNNRVEFSGRLSYKEFIAFQELLVAKWNRPYIVYPALSIILTLIFSERLSLASAHSFVKEYVHWLSILLVPAVFAIYLKRRAWRNINEIQGNIKGEINYQGIIWKTSHGLTEYSWDELLRLKRANDMLALFYTKRCAFFLPRSFFDTSEDWERAIDLCERNLR